MDIMQSLSRKNYACIFVYLVFYYLISDHNTVKGGVEAEKLALAEYNQSIVVIPGMEYR